MNKCVKVILSVLGLSLIFAGCSIKRMAINKVADMLTESTSSTVFTGENDPELVGDALPFAIKLYESLLNANPDHIGLQLQTGSLYIMYANAFLQTPASMLPESAYIEQEFQYQRAKNLYLRGRDMLLNTLEKKYPGFIAALDKKDYEEAFRSTEKDDIPFLYWAGAGWLGAFAIDPFDMKLGLTVPGAAAIMERVMVLDEYYSDGAIHDFFVLYYGSLPDYMGGDAGKARAHFEKAVQFSKGKTTSPYLSLATTVSIQEQKLAEFEKLLNVVLEFDPDEYPENRLVNTLNQRKARWLLQHKEDFFLLDDGSV